MMSADIRFSVTLKIESIEITQVRFNNPRIISLIAKLAIRKSLRERIYTSGIMLATYGDHSRKSITELRAAWDH